MQPCVPPVLTTPRTHNPVRAALERHPALTTHPLTRTPAPVPRTRRDAARYTPADRQGAPHATAATPPPDTPDTANQTQTTTSGSPQNNPPQAAAHTANRTSSN